MLFNIDAFEICLINRMETFRDKQSCRNYLQETKKNYEPNDSNLGIVLKKGFIVTENYTTITNSATFSS